VSNKTEGNALLYLLLIHAINQILLSILYFVILDFSSKKKILVCQFSDDRYILSNKYVKRSFTYDVVFIVRQINGSVIQCYQVTC